MRRQGLQVAPLRQPPRFYSTDDGYLIADGRCITLGEAHSHMLTWQCDALNAERQNAHEHAALCRHAALLLERAARDCANRRRERGFVDVLEMDRQHG